jgi:glycosyltransferase involved in cell wall biosynthesis
VSNLIKTIQVLIPTYNRLDSIKDTIDSVLSNVKVNVQIDIIDNGSSDGTFDQLNHLFSNQINQNVIKIHYFNKTVPMVDNWNRCVDLINQESDYVMLLWSDDILSNYHFIAKLKEFESNPELLCIGNNVAKIDQNSRIVGYRKYGGWGCFQKTILYKNYLGFPSTWLFVNQKGRFKKFISDFPYSADLTFLLEFLNQDHSKFKVLYSDLTYLRVSSDTETSKFFGTSDMLEEHKKFRKYAIKKNIACINFISVQIANLLEKSFFFLRRIFK